MAERQKDAQWPAEFEGMGTKLQCSCNLFTLLKDNREFVSTSLDNWVSLNDTLLKVGIQTRFHKFQIYMDRLLEPANKESVRNIILKHEKIFKQQVHELHRLHRVQKMLMAELGNDVKLQPLSKTTPRAITDTNFRFWGSASTSETSHSSHINYKDCNAVQTSTECSSLRPCYVREGAFQTKNSFNLELGAKDTARELKEIEDRTIIFQELSEEKMSTKIPDLWIDGERELELTLSIGRSQVKKKSRNWLLHHGNDLVCTKMAPSDVGLDRTKECNEASALMGREGLQRPSWLIHALSLNGK